MYQVPYYNNFNQQSSLDRINNQITELQKMKDQIQQTPIQPPTSLTQNFQIAPQNRDVIRYASNIEEVRRDMVFGDTPYFSKDMSVVWVKNTKGEIKSYELKEIVEKDDKDIQIEYLLNEVNTLKGMIKNEQHNANDNGEYDETSATKNDDTIESTTKESEPTSIQRVSRSKAK